MSPEPQKRFIVEYTQGPKAGMTYFLGIRYDRDKLGKEPPITLPAGIAGLNPCGLIKVTPRALIYREMEPMKAENDTQPPASSDRST